MYSCYHSGYWRSLIGVLIIGVAGTASAVTRYVAPAGQSTPAAPYTTTNTAANSIQTVVTASGPGDDVVLLEGTYYLTEQVEIIQKQYLTIRGAAGRTNTIIDAQGNDRAFYLYACTQVELRGLTIQNGKAKQGIHEDLYGGGVYMFDGGRLVDCIVQNCRANFGGGVRIRGTGDLIDCIIRENDADVSGGGVQIAFGGTVNGTELYGNSATNYGGGIYNYQGGVITNSLVYGNTANVGGGIRLWRDSQASATPTTAACTVYSNTAINSTWVGEGGGIQSVGGTIINAVVHDNTAYDNGGGVAIRGGQVMNATIAYNRVLGTGVAGGLWTLGGTVQNSIIYLNDASNPLLADRNTDDSSVVYRNTLTSPSVTGAGNNLSGGPEFIDGDARDFRLRGDSICVDAGLNTGSPGVDRDGTLRPLLGDWTGPVTTTPGQAAVDVGAYEYKLSTARIEGSVTYTSQLRNLLSPAQQTSPLNAKISVPGQSYTITNLTSSGGVGSYVLTNILPGVAWELDFYLDFDANGSYDIDEPLGAYSNTLTLSTNEVVTDINVELVDLDSDGDGLFNYDEINGLVVRSELFITEPFDPDSDDDSFSDFAELYVHDTNPTNTMSFPVSISGTISYFSTNTTREGSIRVTVAPSNLAKRVSLLPPTDGPYSVTNVPTLIPASVSAYQDSNTNGIPDTDEPYGIYEPASVTLTTDLTGADIVLYDPNNDQDGDWLTDYDEVYIHFTSPTNSDSEADGMPDGWEVYFGLDPLTNDAAISTDSDSMSNLEEYQFNTNYFGTNTWLFTDGLNPTRSDTDLDGMPDGWEAAFWPTLNPLVNDADDGILAPDYDDISNLDEYLFSFGYFTNTAFAASAGLNPTSTDTDTDGMIDGWEERYYPQLDPLVIDGVADADNDGMSNREEHDYVRTSNTNLYPLGLDPTDDDTDDDGTLDGADPDPLNPNVFLLPISGNLTYGGGLTGLYYVVATPVSPPGTALTTTISNAGPYSIDLPNTNSYTVAAFLDYDLDGISDVWEASGAYVSTNGSNIVVALTNRVTGVSGADIVLSDSAADTDGDGLDDLDEVTIHFTNPEFWDTDGDGISDGWEVAFSLDPLNVSTNDSLIDIEPDGFTSLQEYIFSTNYFGTNSWVPGDGLNPTNADTDADGLLDGEEVTNWLTNPLLADTDGDDLFDGEEVTNWMTNPLLADTDGDGFEDGFELQVGTAPTNSLSFPATISGTITYVGTQTGMIYVAAVDASTNIYLTSIANPGGYSLTNVPTLATYTISAYRDMNGDMVPDTWEAFGGYGSNPVVLTTNLAGADITLSDPATDTDGDGLIDFDEVNIYGSDPNLIDTDSDIMPDGWEAYFGLSPIVGTNGVVDLELDGMTSLEEYQFSSNALGSVIFAPTNGLDPTVADTDSDGMQDGWEVYFSLDPLDVADGLLDSDSDGMTHAEEYQFSTNYFASAAFDPATGLSPTNADTDADGFTDGEEVAVDSDPLDPTVYPFVVSGTITYGGTQTGTVWLTATSIDGVVSNALTMTGTSVVYSVSNLVTMTDYMFSAYRDSTADGTQNVWEATGDYAGNPVLTPSNALTGIDIVLTDPTGDADGDGLTDYDETYIHATDPHDPDSDADLMPDGWEAYFGLNPISATNITADVEPDGMTSLDEYQYSSNALGSVIFAPTNGLNPTVADTDGDGLLDGWEVFFGLDPLDGLDGALNPDTDGISSLAEYQFSTNYFTNAVYNFADGLDPSNADTDLDRMPDGWEVAYYPVLDPLVADGTNDPDGDLLVNSNEYLYMTSPTNSDTDADSYLDGFEVQWQANPTNAASFPVSFSGTLLNNTLPVLTGTVYVALHYESNANHFANFSIGDITTNGPHPFVVQYVPTLSNYWVSAFMDLSGDGARDSWEPYGVSAVTETNAITPTNDFLVGLIPMGDSTQDTDGDGLTDYDEVTIHGTNPDEADTDFDGFSDYDELFVYITDPLIAASFPASISGNVTYGGTQTGLLVTVADNGSTVYSNVFGIYADGFYSTATNLPTLTNYTLTAYIDANTNGIMDLWEARGAAAGNPYTLFGNVTGADIAIADPSSDTDGDGLTDFEEFYVYGTDPIDPDSDTDGMWDGWEVHFSLNPTNNADAAVDVEPDGLTSLEEFQFSTNYFSTNFFNPADGLDPTVGDTDGDQLLDGQEVLVELTDPLDADTDDDGMPDGWEITFALDPFVDDSFLDADAEGLSNVAEYDFSTNYFDTVDFAATNGLNPNLQDTDSDNLTDYEEIFEYGTDPLVADTDGDGFADDDELLDIGSDPLNLLDPVVVDDDAPADPVPNDPNNINYFSENGSIDFPYDAIQQAVDVAQSGFVVLVLDGEYKSTGNGNINPLGKALTIRSRNGYGSTEILQDSGNGFVVTSGETADTVVQGFTIRTSVADLGSAGVQVVGSAPVIRECYFFDCGEAGVYVRGGGQPLIEDCLFEANQGAIKIEESHPRVERCIMRLNEDEFGGGLYITGTSAITSQPIIVNSLIATNRATDTGGGVYAGAYSQPIFVNTTIADNTADSRGGGIYNAGDTKFWNGILWGNHAPLGPGFALDKAFETAYSCIQTPRPTSIQVITADPEFAGGGDYSLLSSSPCIDLGTGSIPYPGAAAPTNDIDLNPRPIYVSSFPDYDVGAYEYQPGGGLFVQGPGGTAGQVVEAGLPQTITWAYDGAVGTNLLLEYTYQFLADPALTWSPISSNVYRGNAGSGSYTWTVPVTNTTRCYVRVSDATNTLVAGISTFAFAITNGVQVYAPTNGQRYYLGQTVDVAWASSPSAATNVQWALTTDGVNFDPLNGAMVTNSAHLAGGVTNTGSWFLDPLEPGYLTTNGQVRVAGTDLRSGYSGGEIDILGLVVTIPGQGGEVQTGATQNVRWTGLGAGPTVNIRYSDDDGVSFTPVTNGVANAEGTNLFVWTVPTSVTSNAVLEIASPTDTNIVGHSRFVVSDTGGASLSVLGDDIPDQWRLDNGLDPENLDGQSGADDDPDGDGASNAHEWLAGTRPLDRDSVFGVRWISKPVGGGGDVGLAATGVVLRWHTVPGRRYVVEATDSPTAGWTDISGVLEATGEEMEWTDPVPAARRFYRIGTLVE